MIRLAFMTLICGAFLWVGGCKEEGGGAKENASHTPSDSAKAGGEVAAGVTTIQFEKMHHEFGKVTEGETPVFRYNFKNTGTVPLKIQSAKGSCGCTTPEWTRDPVPPGGNGYVEAKFDSNGRSGTNNKHVTVICNTDPKVHKLSFTAEVVAAGKK